MQLNTILGFCGSIMTSVFLNAFLFLSVFLNVEGFVSSATIRLQPWQLDGRSCLGLHVAGMRENIVMMAGFGAKSKEPPRELGAGKGQKAYRRQIETFKGLANAGAEVVDVYVYQTEANDDKFIFAGKVARSSSISLEQALQWQRILIVDHINILEPRARPPMRIFTAPANTEVEVARNAVDLTWVLGGKGAVNTEGMKSVEVGYLPELYEKGEPYFYVKKNPDGTSKTPPQDVKIGSMEEMIEAGVIPSPGGAPTGASSGDAASPAAQAPPADGA